MDACRRSCSCPLLHQIVCAVALPPPRRFLCCEIVAEELMQADSLSWASTEAADPGLLMSE